ncbi:hypothetical protein ACFQL1_17090 [Halomicroarcula sp. GCM10025709]|nr:hypothetical protein [Halomicroarcula sp. YJ-61-S]
MRGVPLRRRRVGISSRTVGPFVFLLDLFVGLVIVVLIYQSQT